MKNNENGDNPVNKQIPFPSLVANRGTHHPRLARENEWCAKKYPYLRLKKFGEGFNNALSNHFYIICCVEPELIWGLCGGFFKGSIDWKKENELIVETHFRNPRERSSKTAAISSICCPGIPICAQLQVSLLVFTLSQFYLLQKKSQMFLDNAYFGYFSLSEIDRYFLYNMKHSYLILISVFDLRRFVYYRSWFFLFFYFLLPFFRFFCFSFSRFILGLNFYLGLCVIDHQQFFLDAGFVCSLN